jgi:hypothetical protein
MNGSMADEQNTDEWIARISALNDAGSDAWSARFEIAGPSLVEEAAIDLERLGAILRPNGPLQEYLVTFPPSALPDVLRAVAAKGGVLCPRQSATLVS